jgi:hypothetical protein
MDTTKRTSARGRAATALAAMLALAFCASLLVPASHAQERRDLLPDLQAAIPDHVVLNVHKAHAFMAFNSAVVNRGEGPLEVIGARASRREPGLRARQMITRSDGAKVYAADVGTLRYVREPRHRYWHLDDVMRYELRAVADFSLVRDGTRRGYCMHDGTTFTHLCGRGLPGLLSLRQGIGPAATSRWAPMAEGQSFDVTNVPSGRYWLVHRADPGGRLLESDDANNASSMLVDFDSRMVGRAHRFRLTLLGACPGVERCQNPQSFAK